MIARQASAVQVRPRPPLHATSTRSSLARSRSSLKAVLASCRSTGSHQSGQRSGGVGLTCRQSPKWGWAPLERSRVALGPAPAVRTAKAEPPPATGPRASFDGWAWRSYPSVDYAGEAMVAIASSEWDKKRFTAWLTARLEPLSGPRAR